MNEKHEVIPNEEIELAQERRDRSQDWLNGLIRQSEESELAYKRACDESNKSEIVSNLIKETFLQICAKKDELIEYLEISEAEELLQDSEIIMALSEEIERLEDELDCLQIVARSLQNEEADLPKKEKEELRIRKSRQKIYSNRSSIVQAEAQLENAEKILQDLNIKLLSVGAKEKGWTLKVMNG